MKITLLLNTRFRPTENSENEAAFKDMTNSESAAILVNRSRLNTGLVKT